MKKTKTCAALILTLCLMAGLCACKEQIAETPELVSDESVYDFSEEASLSIEAIRTLLESPENTESSDDSPSRCCAIAFLGYVDVSDCKVSVNQLAHDQRLADSGYGETYPFLNEISSDHICETEAGSELYALVPGSSVQTVRICLTDGAGEETPGAENSGSDNPETGNPQSGNPRAGNPGVLYERNNADPVLFCVNHDGCSEVQVEITAEDGTVYTFVPEINEQTDKVNCDETVYDFTIYPEDADEAYLDGSWVCRGWADDGGTVRNIKLTLDSSTCTAEYGLYAATGQEMIHYTGTWFIAPEGYSPYSENDLVLDLMSDRGVYMRLGAPSMPFRGGFIVKKCADGTLSVRNTYGDVLANGSEFCDMIFIKDSDE